MKWRSLGLLAVLSSVFLMTGLQKNALWDRDETEYAQALIEMRQSHSWLIPTLENQPFLEKPILTYWLALGPLSFFGENEWGFRFVSVAFGIACVLLTYFLALRLNLAEPAALAAGAILASSWIFAVGFRLLMTDPPFVFFTLLSLYFYLRFRQSRRRSWFWTFISAVAMGLGVLTKGPFGYFPLLVFVACETFGTSENWTAILQRNLFSFFVATTIAAPWFLYTYYSQAQAASNFLLYDNLLRFLSGMEGHTGPMFYYVPVVLIGFFPWSFWLAHYFVNASRHAAALSEADKIVFTWAAFLFVFFSLCANKLPHYAFVLLPILSIWTASGAADAWPKRWTQTAMAISAGILTLAAAAVYWLRPQYFSWKLFLPFAALVLVWGGLRRLQHWTQEKQFWSMTLGSLVGIVLLFLVALPHLETFRVCPQIGRMIAAEVPGGAYLVGYKFSEPSLFVYGRRLFPKAEDELLSQILNVPEPTYMIVQQKDLPPATPELNYKIIAQKSGFAENSGETTLLLIANTFSEIPISRD